MSEAGWTGGHCRNMCGDFIVVVHALQWASERGESAGLSATECEQAESNLDWLLGGHLTGKMATARGMGVKWAPLRMH